MQLITLNLTKEHIADLDELVRKGTYPNRSEAIRFAIRDLLKSELWINHQSSPVANRDAQ